MHWMLLYSNWLAKNVDRGRCKALKVAPIRQEISRLKDLIMRETQAADIQWQSNWTLRSYHAALKGLLRICRQNASTIDLEGCLQYLNFSFCYSTIQNAIKLYTKKFLPWCSIRQWSLDQEFGCKRFFNAFWEWKQEIWANAHKMHESL